MVSTKPFEHMVPVEVFNNYNMNPMFWRKYRKRILNQHILKEWQSERFYKPKEKIQLTFEHFLIFNVLTGNDFFHGFEGKGEERYFFERLKGNTTFQHPFQQNYYTVLNLQQFFADATTAKPWYTVNRWGFERHQARQEEFIKPFSDYHNDFEWGKIKSNFYKLMNEQFTIIEQKYKKSLDTQYDYVV